MVPSSRVQKNQMELERVSLWGAPLCSAKITRCSGGSLACSRKSLPYRPSLEAAVRASDTLALPAVWTGQRRMTNHIDALAGGWEAHTGGPQRWQCVPQLVVVDQALALVGRVPKGNQTCFTRRYMVTLSHITSDVFRRTSKSHNSCNEEHSAL